ncbi:MAG: superoxide dismutase [Proteobacteria bacterium]|nr:superoxide dismutase [Pseudomonadota bacterium]
MTDSTRRDFLQTSVAASLLAATSVSAAAAAANDKPATRFVSDHQHTPVPLPFDPQALNGISEKLVQSHWANNYIGSVNALNSVRGKLTQALSDASTPAYLYNGLKREQLLRTGSVILHELYFSNLGGSGRADAELRSKIANSFGSFDVWETEFRKIGQGLGGGSGWVVLGYNRTLRLLENYWMADHGTAPIDTTPLLVMDMYEHAYQMDYGAAAAKYIDTFLANVQWEAVAKRL